MLVVRQERLKVPTTIPLHFVAVWQMAVEGQSDRMATDTEACRKQRCGTKCRTKKRTHWRSLTLTECLWRLNSGCERSDVVGVVFQQWWQQQWVTSAAADFNERSMQALVHHWQKCVASGGDCWEIEFYSWESDQSNNVTVFSVFIVVSMEINRRHCFGSNLRTITSGRNTLK